MILSIYNTHGDNHSVTNRRRCVRIPLLWKESGVKMQRGKDGRGVCQTVFYFEIQSLLLCCVSHVGLFTLVDPQKTPSCLLLVYLLP